MTPTLLPPARPAKPTDALCGRLAQIVDEGPAAVDRRLCELNTEWSAGRLAKATAGIGLVAGLLLTLFVGPWWAILPAAAGAVFVQYLFCNRSWLAEAFVAVGVRSGVQIEDERIALRVLRGDFQHLPTLAQIEDRDAVSRMEDEGGPAYDDDDPKYDAREAARLVACHASDARG